MSSVFGGRMANAFGGRFGAFFAGDAYLEKTKAKYWIYGHAHGEHSFERYNTKCLMNTLGYPGEIKPQKITIEVDCSDI